MVSNNKSTKSTQSPNVSFPQGTKLSISSQDVKETNNEITAKYEYRSTRVITASKSNPELKLVPVTQKVTFKTSKDIPKLGLMLVGWGGNNGSTLTAGLLANKMGISWETKKGTAKPNYFGSMLMSTTLKVGYNEEGKEVFVPLKDVLPITNPNDIAVTGWDISKMNLADAMNRAQVLDPDLRRQLKGAMSKMVPMPSIYAPDFIAANQEDRADNVLKGGKQEQLDTLRKNIRDFKEEKKLDKVIVVWTANTERFSEIMPGVNDSESSLMRAVQSNHKEVSPSTLFAMAAILEGAPFINGSPQNTFVPGVIQMANSKQVYIGGDDFKSGQTKVKSVMVDFLVNAGIKPLAITSYNHLGNNDGKNLSAPQQFRSKEISKSNVVDDMVSSNRILYPDDEKPDHVVVIKYVPSVGDSKRALDEYESEIFMGGRNTISMHNTCEDSLLAAPLIVDLVLLTELMTRITMAVEEATPATTAMLESTGGKFAKFNPVLSMLSYMLKAPMVPEGAPLINSLFKQRQAIENLFRACLGLAPESELMLESRV